MKVEVANLWAKNLIIGDEIVDITPVETRYGEINQFTVMRDADVHAKEKLRIKAEKLLAEAERNAE